jgi:hypothetical protein
MSNRTTRSRTLAGVAAVIAGLGAVTACARPVGPAPTTTSRDQGVAEHSAQVMPFDVTRATHAFEPGASGLVETVTTRAPVDPRQVELIRGHLAAEATAFARGDFDDPARIHGDDMPGLAELRAGAARLTITYADVPDGGRITYASADPALVDALHRFGAAQTADHGHEHGSGR